MQHDLDFDAGAPVDTWDLSERAVNTHIADLTTSDDLDFIDLKEESTVAGETVLELMDMDGDGEGEGTRISMNMDVAEIDLSGGKAEGVYLLKLMILFLLILRLVWQLLVKLTQLQKR